MTLLINACERGWLPDAVIRAGIRRLVHSRLQKESGTHPSEQYEHFKGLLKEISEGPIALHTDKANEQHYELPPEFFQLVLGPNLKYSGCYWPDDNSDLEGAEAAMLDMYCERAEIENGHRILELGCGWGSLTLWMARRFPNAEITALSNSSLQRQFIEQRANDAGINNIEVITADINDFDTEVQFDRVVSVEMFEHMHNYQALMQHIVGWLKPAGKLFIHIFCHRELMYLFSTEGARDWMGKHFFTGGLMPAADTLLYFQSELLLEEQWRVSGIHYQKSARAWLERLDSNRDAISGVLKDTYGSDADVWLQRWRMFFMACEELFGYRDGGEWMVGHYRFIRR